MTPKAPPERPRGGNEYHALPALPEKPPTTPFEAEPKYPNDFVAWQSAGSDVRAILRAAGMRRDSPDDLKDFHAPWGRLLSLLSAHQPSRHLSQTTLDVLRAGAVKRLFRILRTCSVVELTLRHMKLPLSALGNQPKHTWDLTVCVLSLLSRRISDALKEKSTAPEIQQAWMDWKGSAEDIAYCYEHHDFSDPSRGFDVPDIHLAIAHVAMLLPILDGRFESGLGDLNLSPERWKLFIPVLLRCRAQLTTVSPAEYNGHPDDITRGIINCTSNLTACFQQVLGLRDISRLLQRPKRERPKPLDVTQFAEISCEELVQQNFTLCPNTLSGPSWIHTETRLAQFDFITGLMSGYGTADLMNAIASHNFFAYSAKLFRDLRAARLWPVNTNPIRPPVDCYDRIAMAWKRCLETQAFIMLNGGIAADVVNSNFLFLLESWSLHALNFHVGYVTDIAKSLIVVLVLRIDLSIHTKGVLQVRTIAQRMSTRPDVRPKTAELWKQAYSDMGAWKKLAPPVVAGVSDVCAAIGCESVEPAGQRCGRCTKTFYCSKDCQRSDWSSHKPHCKPAPVPAPPPPSVPDPAPKSKSKSKKKAKNKEPTAQEPIAPADVHLKLT